MIREQYLTPTYKFIIPFFELSVPGSLNLTPQLSTIGFINKEKKPVGADQIVCQKINRRGRKPGKGNLAGSGDNEPESS